MQQSLVDKLFAAEELPETYEKWKEKLIRLDAMERRWNESKKFETSTFQPHPQLQSPAPSQPPPPRPATPAAQPAYTCDQTGTMFHGMGQPMELTMDEAHRRNVCQVCAQPGHIKRNCLLREQQVHAQLAIMSPSDCSV